MDTRFTPRQAAVSQALCTALAKHRPARERLDEVRPASVLMPLWDDGDRVQVVFTKRNQHLPSHAGQVSFPGGMRDPEDQDSKSTALRETHEEVGVPPEQVELITRLDQVVTITGYLVTPFVGLVDPAARFEPNPVEVEHLVMVPLARMLDRASYQTVDMMWEGMPLRQVALYQDGDMIWGATMRILLNFLDAVGGASPEIAALAEGK